MASKRASALLLGSLSLLPVHFAAGQKGTARMESYDGRWWQHLDEDQRNELVNGFLDGAISHGAPAARVVGSASELTSLYQHQPALVAEPLTSVLRNSGKPVAAPSQQGEHYSGKHGFYDGDYWFQASPEGRVGFVEGYLLATSAPDHAALTRARGYAQSITRWYGFDREDAPAPADHPASTAIADVLTRVAPDLR